MTTMTSSAERAANWWRNKLFVYSIRSEDAEDICPWTAAFIPKSVEKGFTMTLSTLESFYKELTNAVMSALSDSDSITLDTVKGGPVGLLAEVSQAAGIPDDIFPENTTMVVDEANVSVNGHMI